LRGALLAVAIVAAVALGGSVAWWLVVPTSLLAEAKATSLTIPREETVERQCYRAIQINTEAAWESVIKYFPEDKYFTLRAEQQLGMIYLRKRKLDEAMPLFEELADLNLDPPNPKLETELNAFGLAGECVVLTMRGEWEKSDTVAGQLFKMRGNLTNERMKRLVREAVEKNGANRGRQSKQEWEKYFETRLGEGG
jgi:hypothetical protein